MGEHDGHRKRLRERFKQGQLDDTGLLELLLCCFVPRRDMRPTAEALMERFGGLAGLLTARPEELMEIRGVGPVLSQALADVMELVLRSWETPAEEPERVQILSTAAAGDLMTSLLDGEENEALAVACLDGDGRVICAGILARGDRRVVGVHPEELIDLALSCGAASVILAHNHPGSVAIPSVDDIRSTRKLELELRKNGIKLMDHLVVADDKDFVSLRDDGQLL